MGRCCRATSWRRSTRSALAAGADSAAYWLERFADDKQRIAIIDEYLADEQAAVRQWAAQALSEWSAPPADDLLGRIALRDPADRLRKHAIAALVLRGGPTAATNAILRGAQHAAERDNALASLLDIAGRLPPSLGRGLRLRATRRLMRRRSREASLVLLYRVLGGTLGAAALTMPLMVAAGYMLWTTGVDRRFGLENTIAWYTFFGTLVAGQQGLLTALGLTFADALAKTPTRLSRLLGTLPAGLALGISLVVVLIAKLLPPSEDYQILYLFSQGFLIGVAGGGGLALAAPPSFQRRWRVAEIALATLYSGLLCAGIMLARKLFGSPAGPITITSYSILAALMGGSIALGMAIVDLLLLKKGGNDV